MPLRCRTPYIWACIDFAVETAMRHSEILSLLWENVDLDTRIVLLPDTKNGSKREVPLTKKAARILSILPKHEDRTFPTTDYTIRHGWDRLVKRAGIEGLRFHDLRHEAVSRFFEMGLSVPEVAAISGHKDYRMLASYTHVSAKILAEKLR